VPLFAVWLIGAHGFGSAAFNENDIDLVIILQLDTTSAEFKSIYGTCFNALEKHGGRLTLAPRVYGLNQYRAALRIRRESLGGDEFDLTPEIRQRFQQSVDQGQLDKQAANLALFNHYIELLGFRRNVIKELAQKRALLLSQFVETGENWALMNELVRLEVPPDKIERVLSPLFSKQLERILRGPTQEERETFLSVALYFRYLSSTSLEQVVVTPL